MGNCEINSMEMIRVDQIGTEQNSRRKDVMGIDTRRDEKT
jgi:hypothetical protein